MIQMFRQNPELKYIGVLMLITTVVKLVTTTIIWKEILFLAQVIFVELFLMLSFQVLSGDLMRRIGELKRLCNLTHAANMRLIRDIGSLKGMMKNIPENFPERCFDKSKRVVANVLKRKATTCSKGKIISQRNKINRMKPYEVRKINNKPGSVQTKIPASQYVEMSASASVAQPDKRVQQARDSSIVRCAKAESAKYVQGKNTKIGVNTRDSKNEIEEKQKEVFEKCIREQHCCTKKRIRGTVLYERLCLNCSALMKRYGQPIYSKICQKCKPMRGKSITHYKRLTKFNGLVEFYCGCKSCFTDDNPPCLKEYCRLCTIPNFTRRVSDQLRPVVSDE